MLYSCLIIEKSLQSSKLPWNQCNMNFNKRMYSISILMIKLGSYVKRGIPFSTLIAGSIHVHRRGYNVSNTICNTICLWQNLNYQSLDLQESVNIMEGSSGSSSNPPGTKFLLLLFSFLFFTLQTDMTPKILNFLHSWTN